jgi:carboxyl-terminal processing protease
MEASRDQPQPGMGERTARTAVVVFLLLAIVSLAFGLGYLLKDVTGDSGGSSKSQAASTAPAADPIGAATLSEIYDILKNNYVDKSTLDADTLKKAAINGVIASLNDPHTTYLSPADLNAGALDLSSTYQGIGASVSDKNGQVQIVAPFRESPAELAGIKAGDILLEVDGEKTDGWSDQVAVQHIRGVKGTSVTLKVKHPNGDIATITIQRGDIQIDSVFSDPQLAGIPGESGTKLVDRTGAEAKDIAYLNISQFHDKTYDELKTKLQAIDGKGYKGLILDLRENPGGLLSATINVADEFLDGGTILSEKDAGGKTQTWTAHPGGLATKIPIVILMDKNSASGAEVLAGALHDNGRAKIVGTRSFGKGTVNQLQTLTKCGDPKNCGALYLSVGRWYTPNGDQIEGVGVKPDFELEMTSDDYINNGDIQVFKAIDILRGN